MAAYRVEVQRGAEKDLSRLSAPLFERVVERIGELAADPRPLGSEKLAALDLYRLSVGDYRVIHEIEERAKLVTILRVRHRREVYRKPR